MRRLVVTAVVALLALASCGGTAEKAVRSSKVSTLELVTGAPAAAADVGTAHFRGTIAVDIDGDSMALPFEGDLDFSGSALSMRMDLSGIPDAPPGARTVEARLVNGVMYMNLGGLVGEGARLPDGVEWVEIDLADFGDVAGQSPTENPGDALQGLREAGTVELIGSEQIGGVDVRHYRAQVDTDRALDNVSGELRDSVDGVRDQLPSTIPMDVWIGDDGLPYRYTMSFRAAGVAVSMDFEFSDFGKDLDLSAPPADATISFRDLLGGAGAPAL